MKYHRGGGLFGGPSKITGEELYEMLKEFEYPVDEDDDKERIKKMEEIKKDINNKVIDKINKESKTSINEYRSNNGRSVLYRVIKYWYDGLNYFDDGEWKKKLINKLLEFVIITEDEKVREKNYKDLKEIVGEENVLKLLEGGWNNGGGKSKRKRKRSNKRRSNKRKSKRKKRRSNKRTKRKRKRRSKKR
jgi:hypothetical protein